MSSSPSSTTVFQPDIYPIYPLISGSASTDLGTWEPLFFEQQAAPNTRGHFLIKMNILQSLQTPIHKGIVQVATGALVPNNSTGIMPSEECFQSYLIMHKTGSEAIIQNMALGSSTNIQDLSEDIDRELASIFVVAKEEFFEDGIKSEFSRRLSSIVTRYGTEAIGAITDLIIGEKVNSETASEALRWLGLIDHSQTYNQRLVLSEIALFAASPKVRDGAALGLAFLDDPAAIPYLKRAIEREQIDGLKKDLEQVLEQLENTINAARTKDY